MALEGTFREDLYYRICEIVVDIPPLRERGSDAVLVANHVLVSACEDSNLPPKRFSNDALHAIEGFDWPGNIRELENRIKRAIVLSESQLINADDLGFFMDSAKTRHSVLNLKEARRSAEIEAILSALEITDDNISAAAKLLGITRPTLYDIMKKYKINSKPAG